MTCYQPHDKTRPRVVRGRHDGDCLANAALSDPCEGCLPCAEDHCTVLWLHEDCQTHAPTVCPKCLGTTRDHLTEIQRLAGLPLVAEALTRGIHSEAADMLGPVADANQWRQRGRHGHKYDADSRLGELEPYTLLGRYDLIVTEHLGHKRTGRITITSAAGYLDRNLPDLAADVEFDFAEMAQSFRECRAHLESVEHDGDQTIRGVPCMECGATLERPAKEPKRCRHSTPARQWLMTLSTYPEIPVAALEERAAKEPCEQCIDQGGSRDHWECPRCHKRHTEDQYRFAVKHLHREEAKWLIDKEMQLRTGVRAGTVREWARLELVAKRQHEGRVVYAVEDVQRVAREKGMMSA